MDTTLASIPYLGETFALSAALCWAFALILFKRSGETVPPLGLSLFKNVIGLIFLTLTLGVLSGLYGSGEVALGHLTRDDLYVLMLSGILGIAIADTLLFYSLNMLGVGPITIIECVYTPSVVFFAWIMLAETITRSDAVGGALILSAILTVAGLKSQGQRTRFQIFVGVIIGVVAISLMALGIVMAKPIIEGAPIIPVALIRLVAGSVVLAVLMAVSRKRGIWFGVFRPSPVWRMCVPASILGNYLAMMFWIGGYKFTTAGKAAILNQTSTILALIFATLFLKEPFTRRKLLAAILALAGVIVVTQVD